MRGKVVLGLKSWWPENRSCRNSKAGKASAVELTPEVIDGRLGGLLAESSLSEQSSEPRQAQLLWEGKLHGVFSSQTTFPIDPSSELHAQGGLYFHGKALFLYRAGASARLTKTGFVQKQQSRCLWYHRGYQLACQDLWEICAPVRPTAPSQAREGGAEVQDLHKTQQRAENSLGKVLLVNEHHWHRRWLLN